MKMRFNTQEVVQRFGPWLILLAAPLVINSLAWSGFVIPQRMRLRAWQDAQAVTDVKPRLKELLAEAYQLKLDWGKVSFAKDYPAVMQILQQSAGRYNVQIKETEMKGQELQKEALRQTLPLELHVTGSFGKLARWMGELESQYGFRIENWSVKKSLEGGVPELNLKITAFTGGA